MFYMIVVNRWGYVRGAYSNLIVLLSLPCSNSLQIALSQHRFSCFLNAASWASWTYSELASGISVLCGGSTEGEPSGVHGDAMRRLEAREAEEASRRLQALNKAVDAAERTCAARSKAAAAAAAGTKKTGKNNTVGMGNDDDATSHKDRTVELTAAAVLIQKRVRGGCARNKPLYLMRDDPVVRVGAGFGTCETIILYILYITLIHLHYHTYTPMCTRLYMYIHHTYT